MVEVENLGKRFGSRWIFRGLGFSLAAGDGLVVLGANGSGKSTLLRVLIGLAAPSEGSVVLPGPDQRQTVGYSALESSVYPYLTAEEHLQTAAQLRGVPARERELLALVGLSDAADRQARHLSTGMRGRLKLALAVQAEPDLLVLDEPGAALDEAGRDLLETICAAQLERGALVLATNDERERRLATHELRLGA
jgi:heme exporter protein A